VRRDGEDTLRIGITGVLPAYRRRGIGRMLKLRVHGWARTHGFREIHTTATRAETAMLALNDALGYPIVGSWGGYELRLGR
jgi:GNAT superfamily N-acetyltransferase